MHSHCAYGMHASVLAVVLLLLLEVTISEVSVAGGEGGGQPPCTSTLLLAVLFEHSNRAWYRHELRRACGWDRSLDSSCKIAGLGHAYAPSSHTSVWYRFLWVSSQFVL